jgi:hypothetical protein
MIQLVSPEPKTPKTRCGEFFGLRRGDLSERKEKARLRGTQAGFFFVSLVVLCHHHCDDNHCTNYGIGHTISLLVVVQLIVATQLMAVKH